MHLSLGEALRVLVPFFALVSAAPSAPTTLVKLSFALEPADPTLLDRTLHEISDPLSPRYGQHLTRDEAHALVAPRDESADVVKRWLAEAGVPRHEITHEGRWIHANVPAGHAKRLAADAGLDASSDIKRSLADSLSDHVSHVHRSDPNVREGQPTRRSVKARDMDVRPRNLGEEQGPELEKHKPDLKNCHKQVTPACLREWYKIPEKKQKPAKGNLFGVIGFLEQTAQHEQLEEFQRRFDPFSIGGNFTSQGLNGGENPQETPDQQYPSGEANHNVQYAVALTYDVPVRYYPVGGLKYDWIPDLDIPEDVDNEGYGVEPFLEFAQALMALDNKHLPLVVTMSYGSNEQHYPKSYATETCNLFGQLGTRGVTVIAASGNAGPGPSCQSNDGKKTKKFLPSFPTSCPYVTAVGGTVLASDTSAAGKSGKSTAADFSGGGFSDYFKRPAWQDKPVQEYLKKNGEQFKKYYNKDGRGYPDVAAHAGPDNEPIMNHGIVEGWGGVSAAAPVFASVVALLNNERLKEKKPPMGFLNPFIYKVGDKAFTDITTGKSIGCLGESYFGLSSPIIPGAGWNTAKGWDPVTGWGTPRFDKLAKEASR